MIGRKFIYSSAGWDEDRKTASFTYRIETDEQVFDLTETLTFPVSIAQTRESENLLRALHLALGMSYYKAFIPPTIEHPYAMSQVEASFWNTVFLHGYGEFLYKNRLNPSVLAVFKEQTGTQTPVSESVTLQNTAVLGIGGGKDSIVAGEVLKSIDLPTTGFVLATGEMLGQTQAVADVMGIDLSATERRIDHHIIDINLLPDAYNGHIPISLIFGLVGAMSALSSSARYVVVANEASSSIPHLTYEDQHINHQWSKSLEFERLFQDYLHTYVSKDLHYFSAIRPLTSVAVAKKFARYPQYFEVFTSDNSLFKIAPTGREHPRWSRDSPKSLSSFILLSPWLSEDDLLRIFGHNFLDDGDLQDLFSAVMGENDQVVLDCVGTPEELRASLAAAQTKSVFSNSRLVRYAKQKGLLDSAKPLAELSRLEKHAIPVEIAEKLKLKILEEL